MRALLRGLCLLILSLPVFATDLPQVQPPRELVSGEFAEGTITQLTAAEVAEFVPWAQNAQNQLNRALTQARSLPLRDRLPHVEHAMQAVVRRSGSRQYQMSMRFALNRGLLLVDELERHVDMNEVGAQESALDLLQRAITVGLAFYESDLSFQRRAQNGDTSSVVEHARFGIAFMQGMYPGVLNVLDAGAQYRLLHKLIEMVNWDLSRDGEAASYAETIVEAYDLLQAMPATPPAEDRASLRLIRRLHSLRIISAQVQATRSRGLRSSYGARSGAGYAAFLHPREGIYYCYPVSSSGERLGAWSSPVAQAHCEAGFAAFLHPNERVYYCYSVSSNGERLGAWSSPVAQSHCEAGFAAFLHPREQVNYCYSVSSSGERLGSWSSPVAQAHCEAGYAVFTHPRDRNNYCYPVARNGERLGSWSTPVAQDLCQR